MSNKEYKQDHLIAKIIVAFIVSILVTIAMTSTFFISWICNVLAIFIWIFGVNPIGYIVETIRKHSHNHEVL